MFKAPLFIKGYSFKERDNDEHVLLRNPHGAGLETLYVIDFYKNATRMVLLENAGVYSPK